MKLTLERFGYGLTSTLGRLWIDGIEVCYTIEDERRKSKVLAETAIPVGTYNVLLRTEGGLHEKYAKRFPKLHKGMLWLQDVPGFTYVYLHVGNTEKDSDGCPLLVSDPQVKGGEFWGSGSELAYQFVYGKAVGRAAAGELTIEVRERSPHA